MPKHLHWCRIITMMLVWLLINGHATSYNFECMQCVQMQRIWCGLSQTCVSSETECHSPFGTDLTNPMDFSFSNVTWMIQTTNLYNLTQSGTSDFVKRLFTNKNHRSYNISDIRPLYQLPSYCYTGIITQISQCSNFKRTYLVQCIRYLSVELYHSGD